MTVRHFLNLSDHSADTLKRILGEATRLKVERGDHAQPLKGKSLAMIFEKNSTRTRVSFEVGMRELGGNPLILSANDLQLGRGETVADTARVLSRYVHCIMMRAMYHENVVELAHYAEVPVINGLTDATHPCQIMADILTVQERLGTIKGKKVVWAGDGNNVLHSWINAAPLFEFALHIACPEGFMPESQYVDAAREKGASIIFHHDVQEAAKDADIVTTDTWVSMGNENSETRRRALTPYQVNDAVMEAAHEHAIFLHCLPAHRGEEVSASVIDGTQSVIWDEAENRLHVQKAIINWCMGVL